MSSPISCKVLFLLKISSMGNITFSSVTSVLFQIFGLVFIVTFLCGCFYFSALGIYRLFKGKTKKELLEENMKLLKENQQLKEKNAEISRRLEHVENVIIQNERSQIESRSNTQLINAGSLKVRSNHIAYIVSQSFEQITNGSSRIKVIHYTDSTNTDSVYATFESILEQLDGNFMMINKNQIVNLLEIDKIQGNELYLKKVRESFIISDARREEFDLRISRL